MRGGRVKLMAGLLAGLLGSTSFGQLAPRNAASYLDRPLSLAMQPSEPESVYAPPSPPHEEEGINEGAVHISISLGYFTDYVYRGLELAELPDFVNPPHTPPPSGAGPRVSGAEDALNLQVATRLYWDLGKLPHPFIDIFVNAADSDPVQTFQTVRPTVGVEWTARPITLIVGHNTYLYPDRDRDFATSEVFAKLEFDDSFLLRTDEPIFTPYLYGAYDYDRYNGWYLEAGLKHEFLFPDSGLVITADCSIAYVRGVQLYQLTTGQDEVNGFQHYQLGLSATYSLNKLFDFPTRYGDWSVQGFVNYTDGISNELASTTQVWGGGGIIFKY